MKTIKLIAGNWIQLRPRLKSIVATQTFYFLINEHDQRLH